MHEPVAIVTGASRGIGLATAQELSRRGYRLSLVAKSEDDLRQAAKSCGTSIIVPADLSKPRDIEKVVSTTLDAMGQVDALVNNAGLAIMKPIDQFSPEEWQATVDVNLSAPFLFCRQLWPIWRRQGGGVVVNVSSAASRDPFPGFAAYGAAKAGLNLLGHALAREGADLGVRVHTVAPAATETAMFRSHFTHEQFDTSKTLSPAEVARIIVQCVCGDLQYTSGEVIYVRKSP
ncbi:MAG TPA: SDR family oxidoreductase [Tepidisphaeraceae bacterium]|nr:SDR family oxidoreductase [Tepidisphaeraceae bacterium]